MLREALQLGRRSSPVLLEGDPHDPLADPDQPVTPAAVLIAVVDRPQPTVILTLRTDTVRKHAGQVAFPGGRVDPEDEDEIAAALREAEEEIELPPAQVEIIGIADRYRTITGYEVTPVIGVVPPDLPLRPHPAEVAAIFEAPLDYLLDPKHQLIRTIQWRGAERCYYEIDWQGRRIWGATAAMIVNLSRRLALVS
jgi:8-oxo-dGTP pyrophosphatase MutT (NUDIX family)